MFPRKIRTHHEHSKGIVFSWMVLIFGFGMSLIFPIYPNFVKEIVGSDYGVSIFYSAMALVMFVGGILSTIIFNKYQRTTITKYGLLILAISYLLLIFVTRLTELSIIGSVRVIFFLFILMALSLFVRDFAKDQNLGEEEGIFYKFHNIGYLLGPLIGGFLATYFNYEVVFFLAAFVMIFGMLYFYHQHIIQKHPAIINQKKTTTTGLFSNIKTYFQEPNRSKAYLLTVLLMAWVGFRKLYIPLYVVESGYIESMSGIILALSIIPFILLEVYIGKYADRKGIRIPIALGLLLMAIGMLIVFFSPFTLLNFAILIISNIGAAFIEPLQECYLFKYVPKKDEDKLYGIYMTADPVAFFLIPALGALILFFYPFNYLFLIFGTILLLSSFYFWSRLKNL